MLYNPGNWPVMVFKVSNDLLLKETTSFCLEFVSNEHIFVFQSGFQILIFCLLLFTTIQIAKLFLENLIHNWCSADILFFRLV